MKIGFIDYYISEWHANNYPTWIKQIKSELGLNAEVAYAWAEEYISKFDGVTTDEWCEKYGVTKCQTIEELCEKSDVLMILSPSSPEKHLPYARVALRYGKPTYIDKTFSVNTDEAKEIFKIAELYGTPVFSSSALRYAEELGDFRGERKIAITGGGSSIDEYIVHQAEMVEALLGTGASSVECEKKNGGYLFTVNYPDDRCATMFYQENEDFSIATKNKKRDCSSNYFLNLIKDILNFYQTTTPPISSEQTVEVMKIREYAIKAAEKRKQPS